MLVGITGVLLLAPTVALAHGGPEITLKQNALTPGGKVTMSADGMGKNGDMVTIMLVGAMYQHSLGMARLMDDAFDNMTFTIPANAPPGTYQIKVENGARVASAQIEMMSASGSGMMGSMTQPQQTTITVRRTTAEWVVSIALVVLTGGLALLLLWRHRSELTTIA
jgi:hypothetical protein